MQPSTMGLHLSKDEKSRFTSISEVRGPVRKLSLTSQRRVSDRIAKQGVVNFSSYSRNASNKERHTKSRCIADDDDTVSTRGSRVMSTALAEKESSQNSNHAAGIMGWFKRQPFASDHGPMISRSSFRQDSSSRCDTSSSRSLRTSGGITGEEASSSPRPIPTYTGTTEQVKPTAVDEDGDVDHLRRVYDMRTWDMYIRITESRKHSNYKSQAPANSYAGGPSTLDYCLDSDAGCHTATDYDEELIFDLE